MLFGSLILFLILLRYDSAMSVEVPTKLMNDGNRIPVVGLGTCCSFSEMRQIVNWAVEAGYRHIDTAALYNNEYQVGRAIIDVIDKRLVKREDLFVTTKLWNNAHGRDKVIPALLKSLQRLGLNYVDLYLIHSPFSPGNVDIVETWQGMIEAQELGLAKSIGVSNFNSQHLAKLQEKTSVKPSVNQIEVHPWHARRDLVTYCQKNNITVVAYGPYVHLAERQKKNMMIFGSTFMEMCRKYKKNITQIVLRYLLDRGVVPIPKSTNKNHLRENIEVFDFRLTQEEVEKINGYDKNKSIYWTF